MVTLHWIFTNGHRWHKQFDNVEAAENGAYLMGLISAPSIDRSWIETDNGDIWLKEKHA
jgi:hypothetical protein